MFYLLKLLKQSDQKNYVFGLVDFTQLESKKEGMDFLVKEEVIRCGQDSAFFVHQWMSGVSNFLSLPPLIFKIFDHFLMTFSSQSVCFTSTLETFVLFIIMS